MLWADLRNCFSADARHYGVGRAPGSQLRRSNQVDPVAADPGNT